ncbi:hypothetical protein AWC38_SpisGene13570 [Stylophora pistillata]|uniref:Uncharacterized protein n=1 Tax=Stylophora pistillata TaxID=50429 RepID=A0A2B4RYN9_STYPI|nr:hypothetical protein AWC38_SpisGene13570 [Stylophora pistillata]
MFKMKSVALSIVVLTVTGLLLRLSPTATADCLNCSDERKICFNLCGNDQKCVNNCNQVFSDCLTSNTINNCNSVRRFLLRDVTEENDKNPELQPDYETLFKAVN